MIDRITIYIEDVELDDLVYLHREWPKMKV